MQIIDATTPEQFQQLLAEHPRVLVDFHKDQCPGCRMLEVSLHRVANSVAGQGTTLLRVQLEVLGEAFFRELGLRQTPTLSLFRDGDERTRLAGLAMNGWPNAARSMVPASTSCRARSRVMPPARITVPP